jgi:hypothetical protein
VAFVHFMHHARFQVIFQQNIVCFPYGCADGLGLVDDIDAVRIILNHRNHPVEVSAGYFEASQGVFLD